MLLLCLMTLVLTFGIPLKSLAKSKTFLLEWQPVAKNTKSRHLMGGRSCLELAKAVRLFD